MNEDLRDWFGKGKKGGAGGGGWDRYNTKGERIGKCAREPGEPKPKCLSKEKAAKMGKEKIAAAVRRKRAKDPVADREGKGGKPKMVSNKIDEVRNAYAVGMAVAKKKYNDEPPLEKKTIKKAHEIAKSIKRDEKMEEAFERFQRLGKNYKVFFTFRGQYKSLDFFFPTAKRPSREDVKTQLHKIYPEAVLVNYFEREREDSKPVVHVEGAKSFGDFLTDLQEKPGDGYLGPTPIPNPIRLAQDAVDATNRKSAEKVKRINKILPGSASMPKHDYFNKGPSAASQKYLGLKNSFVPEGEIVEGYVSVEETVMHLEGNAGPSTPVRIYTFPDGSKRVQPYVGGGGAVPRKGLVKKKTKPTTQVASYEPEGEVVEGRYSGGGALRPTDRIKMGDGSLKSLKDIDAELKKKKLQKESEALDEIGPALALKLGLAAGTAAAGIKIGQKAIERVKNMNKKRREAEEPYKKLLNQENEVEGEAIDEKSAAWTRKAGKNREGGLNEKGRKSYEKENPGSDLKAPSKDKGNPRRKSFCARMKGMKNKLTSAKTANDPDSRINKSLRKWDC